MRIVLVVVEDSTDPGTIIIIGLCAIDLHALKMSITP